MKLESDSPGITPKGGPRGTIEGFSKASRRRLLYQVAKLGDALPIFVTLTYGAVWSEDWNQWKRDLDTWWKRVRREDSSLSAIWKMEFQKRGAPHFHLLVYRSDRGKPFLEKGWVARSWAEVTGDTSEAHVKAGTRVESIRSRRGAMFYAAKYLGKEDSPTDGQAPAGAGRVWGVLSRENLPIETTTIWFSSMEAAAFRYHLAAATSLWRARKQAKGEGVCYELRDDRTAELFPGLLEETISEPRKIPRSTIANDPKLVLAEIRFAISEAKDVPDSVIAKYLERLEHVA